MKKYNAFKQLVSIEAVKEEKCFKLLLSEIEAEKETAIYIPDRFKVRIQKMWFDEDIVDKLVIYKWVSTDGEEYFSIRIYMGKINIAHVMIKKDLYISIDQYSNMNIEALQDWHITPDSPESLELEEEADLC